ncbi:MAG: UV DNA damage repair endonuclease UvsE [Candidatus Bipolaricaulota bacterium]
MRIGYPCIHRTLGCSAAKTFRFASFSLARLDEAVQNNLNCLEAILHFNVDHGIRFFRITSDLIPFASHPELTPPWQHLYARRLADVGRLVLGENVRIDMHPGQYTVLNATDERIVKNAVRDLAYHVQLLDLMELDRTAKVQIHVGGVYGNRESSLARFVRVVRKLGEPIRRRLVVENDERGFPLADCLRIAEETGLPVVLDVCHHRLFSRGESLEDALFAAAATWRGEDGLPIVDYSSPRPGGRFGQHAESLDAEDFSAFLRVSAGLDIDVMLEVKDKEVSALRAIGLSRGDSRLVA